MCQIPRPPLIPDLILYYSLFLHLRWRCMAIFSTGYKLQRHPAYKTDAVPLKADTQTQGQFMKINEVSVSEFKWKSSYFFWVQGLTPVCLGMFD